MIAHHAAISDQRYALSARLLHCLMAVGFLFMWICGYTMTMWVDDESPLEEFLFKLHISVGVTLLFLLVTRVAIRIMRPPPPLPDAFAPWQQRASHLAHLGLYLLPALAILIGWAETDFGGHGVRWFGLAMPKLFPAMETLWGIKVETITATLHQWLAYAMFALAALHVAAVAKHRWFDGHDVLHRMTLGGARSEPED